MPTTDTSEKGLETLIVESLVNEAGYQQGTNEDYDCEHAVDLSRLLAFIQQTQPKVFEMLGLVEDGPKRTQFLHRLQGEVAKRGVIDVLRNEVQHGPCSVELFFGKPSHSNEKAQQLYNANIFSVTRQLHYSKDETRLALDMAIFINGLPIATFELKNRLTKQTVEDAIQQYKRDRDPKELLFKFGRCIVHFAVDDHEVRMCTHLKGKYSWFLPFNKGYKDGAGNPPNPDGISTDYLWKTYLTRDELTDILENYAQFVDEKDEERKNINRFSQDIISSMLYENFWLMQKPVVLGKNTSFSILRAAAKVTPLHGWPISLSGLKKTIKKSLIRLLSLLTV